MNRIGIGTPDSKWYYVIWPTYRRRPVFKIPATARICEQLIRRALTRPHWRPDQVAVRRDAVHLLVRGPAHTPRHRVEADLREFVTDALRRSHAVALPRGPLWGHGAWCGVITRPRAIRTVRTRVANLATSIGVSSIAAALPDSVVSVRQEPSGRVHDVGRLGQHVIFESRRVR